MTKEKKTIWLETDTVRALRLLAQRESRSKSSMVNHLIKRAAIERGCYAPTPIKVVRTNPK